ncbi:amidase [Amycolatopsis jiangsuensis]|uniref:Amidase n=1 Tax=Amycolatopsis jiangsuensis TaxID=1181879 RepID=A0A840J6M7_9PSEU|nr:amidase [Amycolatopsis jiangsuensis]MBB4689048.1 amidase [Amycolatopsis jiangsuensis]
MSELHELSAGQQLRALRAREVSSAELTRHYLSRIDRLGGELGAFVTVTHERALEAATEADERLSRGAQAPLLGLPIGIKDLHATAGIPTSSGSAALAGHVPADDAWTVGLLRKAGAVVAGKTNAPEFGATCYTENDVTPRPAVTPYAPGRYSSGSSGGAASAVAAGLLPVAHASDGAGSTRTPASTCHLVGVKPSRGLVSLAPATGFFSTGIEGPIARTVGDAALLLDVMARPWPGDLYGWRPETSFTAAVDQRPERPLKIAMWSATGFDGEEPHPEAVRAVQRTAAVLTGLGHDVREIAIPAAYEDPVLQAIERWFGFAIATGVPAAVPVERRELLTPYTRHLLALGESLSGVDAMLTQTILARYASTFLAALDEFDVALTPTTNGPAVPLGHFLERGVESVARRMLAWSCYTPWANLTGSPAITLPAHLDDEGVPVGVQLAGRPRRDAELLALSAQLEEAKLWDEVHPPCWNR